MAQNFLTDCESYIFLRFIHLIRPIHPLSMQRPSPISSDTLLTPPRNPPTTSPPHQPACPAHQTPPLHPSAAPASSRNSSPRARPASRRGIRRCTRLTLCSGGRALLPSVDNKRNAHGRQDEKGRSQMQRGRGRRRSWIIGMGR